MRTVLITGANRGLGLELASAFMRSGYALILHAREESSMAEALRSLPNHECIVGDLRDKETVWRLRDAAGEQLDILINNAGAYLGGRFDSLHQQEIRDTLMTDLEAPILLTRLCWPALVKGRGMVVNINSLAAVSPGAGETAYAAAKSGLAGFSDALQYDATAAGVRVLSVLIGGMKTRMTEGRNGHDQMIEPAEAAALIADLCRREYATMRVTSIELKRRVYL